MRKPTKDAIRLQAYYFWEEYGKPSAEEMSPVTIWLQAEEYLHELWQGIS